MIAEIDRALDNCRKVPDHSRRIGLPVAFIRMFNEHAFFKRATPLVRWTEGFEPCRNEMLFEHNSSCCCYSTAFTALETGFPKRSCSNKRITLAAMPHW